MSTIKAIWTNGRIVPEEPVSWPEGCQLEVREARPAELECMTGLAEIVGGLEASDSREVSWEIARRRLGKLVCWPFDRAAAYEYGRIYAELKRRGRPMQQIDMMIAAIASSLGNCTVVSGDS